VCLVDDRVFEPQWILRASNLGHDLSVYVSLASPLPVYGRKLATREP
jgi:hypothetical protein